MRFPLLIIFLVFMFLFLFLVLMLSELGHTVTSLTLPASKWLKNKMIIFSSGEYCFRYEGIRRENTLEVLDSKGSLLLMGS